MSRRIERAREELLDLGLRNSLISYRQTSRGVQVVDELPSEILRSLVLETKRMSFDPAPDTEKQGVLVQPEEDLSDSLASRHVDHRLQTTVPSAQLQSKLLSTYHAARTSIEEQGVNVLFLALGMIEWYEAASSQEPRKAPIVLVPVELSRSNALDRFHLSYTGEEIGANLSIEAKLKMEFDIQLPQMAATEDLDINAYFSDVEMAISNQPRWRVNREAVALGFFSFGKFLMHRDLDLTTWPEELQPTEHPILRSLLGEGFDEPASAIGEDAFLDPLMNAAEIHQVVDADSSQTVTILDAIHGRNLVVQGPPGTGKSQTITNIIAEAIGAGKTVLFVAEKMAALEVVKRRLDSVGLGDACLELHSHKINKRSVVQELHRTLGLGRPRVDRLETELTTLENHRARLNEYCDAINTPIGESGVTPYEAYGQLIQIRHISGESEWPRPQLPSIETWQAVEFTRRESLVHELQARVAAMGVLAKHPFWGVRKKLLLPTEAPQLRGLLAQTRANLETLGRLAATLAPAFGLQTPVDRKEAELVIAALQRVSEAPDVPGLAFADDAWNSQRDRLNVLLDAGQRWLEIREHHATSLNPDVWDRDVQQLHDTLSEYRSRWWRVLSGSYRSARAEVAGHCQEDGPDSIEEQIRLVADVIESQRLMAVVNEQRDLGSRLFGPNWKGASSNWANLRSWADWITALHDDVLAQRVPLGVVSYLDSAPDRAEVRAGLDALKTALTAYSESLESVRIALEFDSAQRFGPGASLPEQPFATQYQLLRSWVEHFDTINQMITMNVAGAACAEEGLTHVVGLAQHWPDASIHLGPVFKRARFEALLDKAIVERPSLAQFDGDGHAHVVSRFRELDMLTFEHNRSRLAHAHWSRVPRGDGGGQLAILRREFEKKSRHLPVRQLVGKAGNAIQAIKPVFMMSPLSIATYIPPGTVTFDMVIFDEASQVKPVDAFGALLRGQQAVVVGDSKQLPPTSFFDALIHTDEDDEESATSDIESILGLFAASNAPQRMLRWHYRSRHESLITVSNHEFYENRLVLFPSPDASRTDSGLHYHHLKDTSYDRGKTRTNPQEAAFVARAVMAHARQSPQLTLGVAAFSVAQTQAVIDQVELLRRQDPSCEAFFSAHQHEPFFVKNLENVQGDERDVIFISVGYGRTADGYLTMSFGPLNNDGGERRLNVLITRARRRCEVFTNLTADDIDLNRTQARGVASFKRFLKYAETGILDVPRESGLDFGSPFEEAVFNALTEQGYIVAKQVGSAGFSIDLAVVDPRKPGRYLLAVECDGATYHSARSARDRDRLRQQVLENLGWRVHRIWSTDWFKNAERELKRAVAAIEDAMARAPVTEIPVPAASDTTIEREVELANLVAPESAPAYVLATPVVQLNGRELHLVPTPQIAMWITEIVRVEGPVHRDEVTRRIVDAAGIGRTGGRIRAAIEAGIRQATFANAIQERDEFLWSTDMQLPSVRDRSSLPNALRSLGMIAPDELELTVESVVRASYGIDMEDVPPETCRLLGFQRVTADMRATVAARIEQMCVDGRLIAQGTHLMVADS